MLQQQCKPCVPGKYADLEGLAHCRLCEAGKFRTDEDAASLESLACTECELGRYQPQQGKMVCIKCAAGKHRTAVDAAA